MAKTKKEEEILEDKVSEDSVEEKNEQEVESPEVGEKAEENESSQDDEKSFEKAKKEEKSLSKEEETFKVQLQRMQAEFQNFRKRVEKEKAELSLFVKAEFVKRFLPLLDDMNRLKTNLESDEKTLKNALDMVFKKLDDFTKSESIETFAEVGEVFDPNLHDALMQVPTDDKKQDETIAQVFEPGIKVGERIVRHAKVQVFQHQ
jgi:molecular chaperone GrpE